MKIAFLTTIFPEPKNYLMDFFVSLEKQTYRKFDVIVVNDGFRNFLCIKKIFNNLNIIELKYRNTIAKNREFGINFCIKRGYDIIIFGDSDDYFSKNRVKDSLKFLKKYDIVVNDLDLFKNKRIYLKKYISKRVRNNSLIEYDFIKDKNIFGLSNTALRTSILGKEVAFEKDLITVDWFLFKKLLKKNYKAIFTNKIITYYRQYENNIIGLKFNDNFKLWWEK